MERSSCRNSTQTQRRSCLIFRFADDPLGTAEVTSAALAFRPSGRREQIAQIKDDLKGKKALLKSGGRRLPHSLHDKPGAKKKPTAMRELRPSKGCESRAQSETRAAVAPRSKRLEPDASQFVLRDGRRYGPL